MKAKRQGRTASWRALCAALVLLCGAMAAPVGLAGRSPADVCAMACCVEKGHCCCKPRHAYVEGQTTDGKPRLAPTEIAAPCPAGCRGVLLGHLNLCNRVGVTCGRSRLLTQALPQDHTLTRER